MQKPSVGRIVLVPVDALRILANGAEELPGIITRVWSDTMVNLAVFVDGAVTGDAVISKTSAKLYADADAAAAGGAHEGHAYAELRCYWPPRV